MSVIAMIIKDQSHHFQFIVKHFGSTQYHARTTTFLSTMAKYMCVLPGVNYGCGLLLESFGGMPTLQINYTRTSVYLASIPAGTSTKNCVHWAQTCHRGTQARYDYGETRNWEKYGRPSPPSFNLSHIHTPLHLFWSREDWLADDTDIRLFLDQVDPSVIKSAKIIPGFNHFDFIFGTEAGDRVFKHILNRIAEGGTNHVDYVPRRYRTPAEDQGYCTRDYCSSRDTMSVAFDFTDKKILVTGASQGIGRAICIALCNAGACVYGMARNEAALDALGAEAGPKFTAIVADVTLGAEEISTLLKKHQPFDGLVNNAGIAVLEPAESTSEESMERIMAVNFRAPVVLAQIVLRGMRAASVSGSIVNVSSQAGLVPLKDHLAYCSSKAALDMATRCMAAEFGEYGVRVNSVSPTVVMTEMGKKAWSDPAKAGKLLDRMPSGRFAEESDVVQSVLFLLSNGSAMTTGHALPIDGGFTTC
ncbi:dhs-21 [Pristionchus pacificus]|uniref:Dhs-21 n=1 Tax=Pristionchus pacificus TaxID=54126 RepID=A0A2A6C7C6_PRIPA|nr:dhs-21 [Pristionchus pacificus]|eukprot:PDM74084.1 dhs-21 [Pristionchus pacificus]